jgi:SET domain-containing protein
MLLVRVRLAPSPIHGLGVFAVDSIAAGTRVWEFTPGFDLNLNPKQLDALPEHLRERLLHYGYIEKQRGRYILCCDDARFINHSDTPCLRIEAGGDVAARDIRAGEELTVDYGELETGPPPSRGRHR